jgi:hypothetical protein
VIRPLAVVPFQDAETVANCVALTGDAVAVKEAVLSAAKTVTAAGTDRAVLLEERAILMFLDVAAESVTVQVVDFPATAAGLQVRVLIVCASPAIEQINEKAATRSAILDIILLKMCWVASS